MMSSRLVQVYERVVISNSSLSCFTLLGGCR